MARLYRYTIATASGESIEIISAISNAYALVGNAMTGGYCERDARYKYVMNDDGVRITCAEVGGDADAS